MLQQLMSKKLKYRPRRWLKKMSSYSRGPHKKYLINFFCRYFNVGAWIIRYWTGPLLYNEGYKIGGRDSKNIVGAILNATVLKRDLKAESFTLTPNLVILSDLVFWRVCFSIRPPPGLLSVLGPLERYITPTFDAALLYSSQYTLPYRPIPRGQFQKCLHIQRVICHN